MTRYWPADVHLMGKEIVRQHTVYWPAFLMSAGLPVPKRVIGHGWWLMNEAKMSKSLGNVVRPQGYVDLFGVDALRYFVLREMVVGQDANFADEVFLTRYNSDLANDLGNVVSRVTTMIVAVLRRDRAAGRRWRGRRARRRSPSGRRGGDRRHRRRSRAVRLQRGPARHLGAHFDAQQIHRCARALVAGEVAESRPLLETTLYNAADALRVVSALVEPVMPRSSGRIRAMLGTAHESWVDLQPGTLKAGTKLGTIEPLFPRMEKTVDELRADPAAAAAPVKMSDSGGGNPAPAAERPGTSRRRGGALGARRCRRGQDLDRRLHEGRPPRREGADRREGPELAEARQADDRRRRGAANAGGRHRRGLRTGSARRTHDRHGLQPEAGEADGHRVERHGARGESGRRQADARRLRR